MSTVALELVIRALRNGYKVVGVSAPYHERLIGQSTVTLGKTLHAAKETIRLWWLMRKADR